MGGDSEFGQPPLKRLKLSKLYPEIPLAGSTGVSAAGSGVPMARVPANDGDTVGSQGQIRKVEFVRVIAQALFSLGYNHAGEVLEEESGIQLQSPMVTTFQQNVLNGNWDESVATLGKIDALEEETLKAASFLILQQKYLESLDRGDTITALKTLRTEISRLGINTLRVHQLASFIVLPSQDLLREKSNWRGAGEDSRGHLLEELQHLLPPSIMVPEKRLEHLVEQAVALQREACAFHNSMDHALSLYADHYCSRDRIPTETLQKTTLCMCHDRVFLHLWNGDTESAEIIVNFQDLKVLEAHEDEVWFLQFSHNGRYLASSSKDCTAVIWEVQEDDTLKLSHTLNGHSRPVSFVAWSLDDTMLLTCGNEEVVKLWDISTGVCNHTFDKPNSRFTSCAWFPDSRRFVSGGLDKCIYMWDLEGNELESWKGARMPRIDDLAITLDGRHMVSVCAHKDIRIYNLEEKTERVIEEEKFITSLSVSKDGKYLLVNLVSQEIHLWDIGTNSKSPLKYRGHRQGRYVIRSCFGGSDHAFIVSGSEDSQVYIWHSGNGDLLEVLPGHSGTVNSVSWNPVNPHMFASASDDHTIRIWGVTKRPAVISKQVPGSWNGFNHLVSGGTRGLLEILRPLHSEVE